MSSKRSFGDVEAAMQEWLPWLSLAGAAVSAGVSVFSLRRLGRIVAHNLTWKLSGIPLEARQRAMFKASCDDLGIEMPELNPRAEAEVISLPSQPALPPPDEPPKAS
jgi:hypothetical protein